MDYPKIRILSVTKPVAQKDFPCALGWDNPHTIGKGTQYVRVVWEHKDVDEPVQSDHVCVNCWVNS